MRVRFGRYQPALSFASGVRSRSTELLRSSLGHEAMVVLRPDLALRCRPPQIPLGELQYQDSEPASFSIQKVAEEAVAVRHPLQAGAAGARWWSLQKGGVLSVAAAVSLLMAATEGRIPVEVRPQAAA